MAKAANGDRAAVQPAERRRDVEFASDGLLGMVLQERVDGAGVFVECVDAGGQAESAGVQAGWTLAAINRQPAASLDLDGVMGLLGACGRPLRLSFGVGADMSQHFRRHARSTAADFSASRDISSPAAAAPTSPKAIAAPSAKPAARPVKRARTSDAASGASPPAVGSAERTCDCGLPVAHRRSQTQKNPDRPFMCCKNYKPPGAGGHAAGCKFFQWSDEAPAAAA